ncbi:hypothetical protein [Lysobacter gummosus]|uniref:hypothetical protein n=1 Tax=Lysobacter gummosus TaxID=262324 RepID=UPI00363644F4
MRSGRGSAAADGKRHRPKTHWGGVGKVWTESADYDDSVRAVNRCHCCKPGRS